VLNSPLNFNDPTGLDKQPPKKYADKYDCIADANSNFVKSTYYDPGKSEGGILRQIYDKAKELAVGKEIERTGKGGAVALYVNGAHLLGRAAAHGAEFYSVWGDVLDYGTQIGFGVAGAVRNGIQFNSAYDC
jgi:hypothetical protein